LTPFTIARNKQLLSIPSHNDAVTIRRAVRLHFDATPAAIVSFSYSDVINGIQAEMGMVPSAAGIITFTPQWVNVYALSELHNQIVVRIFDQPESTSSTTYINSNYYRATDSSTASGISAIKSIIPTPATYTVGSNDNTALKNLNFVTLAATANCTFTVDFGGTFTFSTSAGPVLTVPYSKKSLSPIEEISNSINRVNLSSLDPHCSSQ